MASIAMRGALLCGLFVHVCAQIRVMAPRDLVQRLDGTGRIHGSTATFGAPFYGDIVFGRLSWGESRGNHHCSKDDYDLQGVDRSLRGDGGNGGLINIVLVHRGTCAFTKKVHVASAKGAHAVIIVDRNDSQLTSADMDRIIVTDDGYGGDIHIPSILVPKEEGEQLIDAARGGEVVVELKWDLPANHVVELDLWMSSSSHESQKFLKEFSHRRKVLNEVVRFRPHYDVFALPDSDPGVYQDLCTDASGSYCTKDPDGSGAVTGRDVLEEDVRQLCIHELTKAPRTSVTDLAAGKPMVEYAEKFWDYVERFGEACPLDGRSEETRFGTPCAERLMKSVGLDVPKVQECVATTKERKLLEERKNVAWSPHAVRINGWRYSGRMDADLVTRAICSGFIDQPNECQDLLRPRDPFEKYAGAPAGPSGVSAGTMIATFLVLVLIAGIVALLYKRSLRKQMRVAVREEVMLEVQSQLASYSKLSAGI